ncbi:TPA: phage repressor protein [Enterobacter cloacae]|uniref:phage repressor protein CI n=1 Tax=Enterobacter cloacae TaxID=550 RepID=UPI001CC76DEE|nr:phage repressor protein CI [Enterobacter cloacae]EGS1687023.1 phage repressor protein [Enterobacter cloacae]MBZ5212282.1 phage repressor protein CI [Enterobacter cloacae subsp. cloacae]HAS1142014.1 phage repressor protein [Enterobacter cloacae]
MSTNNFAKQDDLNLIRDCIAQNRGGKEVIGRILEAYGFTTRITLCRQLGVSQSTMANRYARDTFPADWVIVCHLETGASLIWLSTGSGSKFVDNRDDRSIHLKRIDITNGNLTTQNDVIVDVSTIPEGLTSPFILTSDKTSYMADSYDGELVDGFWFIEIDGIASVREVYRFPAGRVRIENGKASFECAVKDVKVLGKIISKTEFMD